MLVLGIDVGTTGTKSVVANAQGKILAGAYKEYELKSEPDGRVSQNAEDWYDAIVKTVRELGKECDLSEVGAIGLSTQGASMLATDKDGTPLCDVITWMDSRAKKEVAYLDEKIGTEKIYEKCGWPLSPLNPRICKPPSDGTICCRPDKRRNKTDFQYQNGRLGRGDFERRRSFKRKNARGASRGSKNRKSH